ncbi:cell adhesion molecule Dscam1-like isoform X2 [Ornithodoros turicata]|uniref:cell adhesion molecule Dscam1-like isoform X2 n=1 Tax=Ornithodoros turicata TaxID=34597 RepID=UPI0031397E50
MTWGASMEGLKSVVVVWLCAGLMLRHEVSPFQHDRRGPSFIHEPPRRVNFSNDTGASVPCTAVGSPEPRVQWTTSDGVPVTDIRSLRYVRPNGSLVFPPFRGEDYRQDVHAAIYRCTASNALGTIVSRDVRVRAVVRQAYQAEVYDEYVVTGNTAVMKCHIPGFVRDFVTVTSWIEEPSGTVIDSSSATGTKYQVFPEGELYIRDVDKGYAYRSYRCQTRDTLSPDVIHNSLPGRLIVSDSHSSLVPRIVHSRTRITATAGSAMSLPCAAHGSPPPRYRWQRSDGAPVFLDQRTSQLDGVLFIRKLSSRDAGKLTCVAANSAGEDRAVTDVIITEPLAVSIQPTRQQAHVGQALNIKCSVTGHPVNAVVWTLNGRQLHHGDRVPMTSSDTLTIRSVQKEDKGMYQCFATNDEDVAQATFELSLAEDLPELRETFHTETVEPGRRLSLKCSASGSPLPQITWALDDAPVPETHRVRFGDYVTQFGVVVSYLNFSVIEVQDGGEYRCTANNGVGAVVHSARINVPGRPVVRPMRNLTVLAGEVLRLRCPVAGYPLESIAWERAGVKLPYNHRQKVHDNGTLEVHHVERATDEGPYTCVAKDAEGHSAENNVYVNVKVKPTIEPFSYPPSIREGQRASVMCTVSSGDMPINITWYRDGEPIGPANPQTRGILVSTVADYSSTLHFKSVRLEYRGNYTCVASNDAGTVSYSTTMVIHVPPQWVIEPTETSVVKGKNVVIDCEADGFPLPRVRWTKAEGDAPRDFKPIVSSAHVQVFENGSLGINGAKEDDAGYFLCQASNGIGQGLSKVVKVTVYIAAHFKTKFTAEMVRKGQNTRLKCDATGDKPISISWLKDKQPVSPKQDARYELVETIQNTGVTSEIIIRQADRRDSALFTCIATNNFGQDDTNTQLIVQEPPDAPQDLKVLEVTSRSVRLEWTAPYSGNSPITHYTVQYKDEGSKWHAKMQNLSTVASETSGTVRGLKPSAVYHFRVFAENRIGRSDGSHAVKTTTTEEAPGGPPSKVRALPTSSQSIKVSWKPPGKELHFGTIIGYYLGYRVAGSSEPYIYKTMDTTSAGNAGGECELTGLKRATQYGVIVQAYNNKGTGPPSDQVVVQTLDSDPPSPPYLRVESTTSSSVTLRWERAAQDQNPVTGADHITPRKDVQRESSTGISEVTVVVPVVVSILVVVAVLVVVCLVVRRKHSSGSTQSGSSLYGTRKTVMQETMQMTDMEGKLGKGCSSTAYFPAPYATTHLGTRGPEKRTDHLDEPLYATVKRTPRPPRSDGHIYQCPALARNGRPASRVT